MPDSGRQPHGSRSGGGGVPALHGDGARCRKNASPLRIYGGSRMSAAPQTATTAEYSPLRSRARFGMLALISAGTLINYLDRTVLGIAAPRMTAELHLSPAVMGI